MSVMSGTRLTLAAVRASLNSVSVVPAARIGAHALPVCWQLNDLYKYPILSEITTITGLITKIIGFSSCQ